MLVKPVKRRVLSFIWEMTSNALRNAAGLIKGMMPSITSTRAIAARMSLHMVYEYRSNKQRRGALFFNQVFSPPVVNRLVRVSR